MIHFENVTKKYSANTGIDNVSLDIDRGEFVFLVGPSGAGKSTFIKLVMKEIEADVGSIRVMGNEIVELPARSLPKHRRNIGMIFDVILAADRNVITERVPCSLIKYLNLFR